LKLVTSSLKLSDRNKRQESRVKNQDKLSDLKYFDFSYQRTAFSKQPLTNNFLETCN